MDRLEQIERLRKRADVTYDEAKNAYEASDGDLLEAIILLERQGKVKTPQGEGYYSNEKANEAGHHQSEEEKKDGFVDNLEKFGRFLTKLINKGNNTAFEVVHDDVVKVKIPVTALVILLLFIPYVIIPGMIIGLFFNLRYRFNEDV